MISVDGSYHEGGGQILRTALGLSALTKQPFEIINIRKNRPRPGLRPQHLSCVKAVAELCNAGFEGAELSSTSVRFYPSDIKSGTLSVDIGTAGSVTLLLQSLLLPVLFGGKKFRIRVTGGTDVPFSPPSTYFANVLLPHLNKFCDKLEFSVSRHGFAPAGGGKAELFVKPKFILGNYASFNDFLAGLRSAPTARISQLNQGRLLQVKGVSLASKELQKAEVAERQAKSAKLLLSRLGVPVRVDGSYCDSLSPGSAIVLWAAFSDSDEVSQINPVILGGSSLGERGRRAEQVGADAANDLLRQINSKAPVDRHLADQLLPFLALASGSMKVSEITPHCITNIYTIEKFLGKVFTVNDSDKTISAA